MTLYLAPLGYSISRYISFCKGSFNLSHFKMPVGFNQSFFRNLKKVAVKIFRKNRLANFYTRRKLVVNWLWCCRVINWSRWCYFDVGIIKCFCFVRLIFVFNEREWENGGKMESRHSASFLFFATRWWNSQLATLEDIFNLFYQNTFTYFWKHMEVNFWSSFL